MKKLFSIISISLIALLFVISCSNQTATPGTSPETKKQMSQSEYASNSKAITALSVVEVYGMDIEKPKSKAITGAEEFRFDKDVTINTEELKGKSITYPILKQMVDNLPNNFEVTIKSGSYFTYTISENNSFTYHTIDIKISIDGKTIEIEKDYDDKWIEIDGTFFDSTPIEEMLELANDAADFIEDLFNKFIWSSIKSGDNKIDIEIKDGDNVEGKITGTLIVSKTDKDFSMIFDLKCIEYDEGKEGESYSLYVSLKFNTIFESFVCDTNIKQLLEKLVDSITIKVNDKDIWNKAFLQELD